MSEPITEQELRVAEQTWTQEIACWPAAIEARFDVHSRRIIVSLETRLDLLLNPESFPGFENASDDLLSQVEIEASGYALHFPLLDEGIWLPTLYEQTFAGALKRASASASLETTVAA